MPAATIPPRCLEGQSLSGPRQGGLLLPLAHQQPHDPWWTGSSGQRAPRIPILAGLLLSGAPAQCRGGVCCCVRLLLRCIQYAHACVSSVCASVGPCALAALMSARHARTRSTHACTHAHAAHTCITQHVRMYAHAARMHAHTHTQHTYASRSTHACTHTRKGQGVVHAHTRTRSTHACMHAHAAHIHMSEHSRTHARTHLALKLLLLPQLLLLKRPLLRAPPLPDLRTLLPSAVALYFKRKRRIARMPPPRR